MATVNLYDILGVTPDSSLKDLKTAYRKLVLKYHPDKEDGSEELFELVTYAYNVLSNEQSRSEYDGLYKKFKESEGDFHQLKTRAKEFSSAQAPIQVSGQAQAQSQTQKASKKDEEMFKQGWEQLNRQHGFDEDSQNDSIDEDNARKLYEKMISDRKRQDTEELHERIFEKGVWNGAKFNEAFDLSNKSHMELVPHSGNPMAWNSSASVPYTEFDNIDKLYTDKEEAGTIENTKYGPVNFDIKKNKLSKEEIVKLSGANYTSDHNKKEQGYESMIKKKMADRETETTKYNSRSVSDYDTSDDMGGYGIFSQLGISASNSLLLDFDDKKLKENYKKLLQERKEGYHEAVQQPRQVAPQRPAPKRALQPNIPRFTPEVQQPHNSGSDDDRIQDRYQKMMQERKMELLKQKYPQKDIADPDFENTELYDNPLFDGPRGQKQEEENTGESYKDRYQRMMDERKRIR